MKQKKEKCCSSLTSSKQLALADAKQEPSVPDWDGTQRWGLPPGLRDAREATARSEMETKRQVPICKPDGKEGHLFCFKIVMDVWKKKDRIWF